MSSVSKGDSRRKGKGPPCRQKDNQKASPKGGNELGEFGEQKGGKYDRAQGGRSC